MAKQIKKTEPSQNPTDEPSGDVQQVDIPPIDEGVDSVTEAPGLESVDALPALAARAAEGRAAAEALPEDHPERPEVVPENETPAARLARLEKRQAKRSAFRRGQITERMRVISDRLRQLPDDPMARRKVIEKSLADLRVQRLEAEKTFVKRERELRAEHLTVGAEVNAELEERRTLGIELERLTAEINQIQN